MKKILICISIIAIIAIILISISNYKKPVLYVITGDFLLDSNNTRDVKNVYIELSEYRYIFSEPKYFASVNIDGNIKTTGVNSSPIKFRTQNNNLIISTDERMKYIKYKNYSYDNTEYIIEIDIKKNRSKAILSILNTAKNDKEYYIGILSIQKSN